MLEVFKFVVVCLVFILITAFSLPWLYTCALILLITVIFWDFDFTIGLERHAVQKTRNFYRQVRNYFVRFFDSETNINRYQNTPTMNSINKRNTFDLSSFNKSGNVVSPISNSSNNSHRLVQCRQTSTPLTRTSPWQKNSLNNIQNARTPPSAINRTPRYSLSSTSTSPKIPSNDAQPRPTIQTVTGPLLASTRFNVNLGTYTESVSPGLASRVVQYNNDLACEQTSTHQAKYGSPGQFPIVKLYKKEVPLLSQTTRRCTVRIAPPDLFLYNSEQANTILRDSFTQHNGMEVNGAQGDTEINTRSVLEALKEISRKRIHLNDDEGDISKRQRKDSVSMRCESPDQLNKDGKRMREETPPKSKELCATPKRICVLNEIDSSLSSSRMLKLQQGKKRRAALNLPIENINKQRKISNDSVSRETQTTSNVTAVKSVLTNTNSKPQKVTTAAQTEIDGFKETYLVLQEARRKQPGRERTLQDIDDENSTLPFKRNDSQPKRQIFSEEPLKILQNNKLELMLSVLTGNAPKLIPVPNLTLTAAKKKLEAKDTVDVGVKEVVSILSPKNKVKHDKHVTFAIPTTEAEKNQESKPNVEVTSVPEITSANPLSNIIVSSSPSNSFTTLTPTSLFNNLLTSQPLLSLTTVPSFSATESLKMSTPTFGTVSVSTVTNSIVKPIVTSTINLSSSFDLSKPVSPAFGTPIASSISETPSANFQFPSAPVRSQLSATPVSTVAPALSFTPPGVSSSQAPVKKFISPAVLPDLPTFNFGTTNASIVSTSVTFSTAAVATTSLFSFGTKTSTTSPSNFPFGITTPSQAPKVAGGFKFDLTKSSPKSGAAKPPAFGSESNSMKSDSLPFGSTNMSNIPALPSYSASTAKNEGSFGTSLNSAKVFGTLPSTTSVTFGTSNVFEAPTKTSAVVFGAPTTTSPVVFGASTTTNAVVFGAPTTTVSFGTPTTTNTIVFGSPKSSVFGTPSTTNSSIFGAPTTTNSIAFGALTTASSVAFGATIVAPNTTAPAMFGATSTSFSTPNTTASSVGFGTAVTTTASGMFGVSTPGLFNSSNTFNNNTTGFGIPTTVVSGGLFNNPLSSTFSSAKPNETSAFGTTKPAVPTVSGFPAFSTPTTTTASSTFGAFGNAQTTAFGTTTTTTTSNFTFGSNTTTAVKPFAFGATPTTAQPTMFTSAVSNTPPTMFPATTVSNLFTGSSSGFGTVATSTSSSGFGNGENRTFGVPTTTSASFGQTGSGTFGTAAFGNGTNNNNNNAFNSSGSTGFGSTPTLPNNNAFGPSTTFGQGSAFSATNSTFGSGAGSSSTFACDFGNTSNSTPQLPSFGSFPVSSAATVPSGVFTFSGSAPATNPSTFQFGASAQTSKPAGFNFSATTNTPNINFGAGAASTNFTAPAPSFGQFNSPAPATGMFSIGSGSTAPKQRPMIKARRKM